MARVAHNVDPGATRPRPDPPMHSTDTQAPAGDDTPQAAPAFDQLGLPEALLR